MYRTFFNFATTAAALAGILALAPALPAQDIPAAIEVQARGPIHEAFAQPLQPNPQPGPLVNRQPPAPVPEEPPDKRPEGNNVVWIPGYWAWDAQRNDFLWVSGIWRNAPPAENFVPGYWTQEADGWRWVPGFWSATQPDQVRYDPAPPASAENGPSAPAPDDNSVYSPGYWAFQDTGYVWRPGFWMAGRPGLVWIPAHYVWTPGGYVFIPGYWDYALDDRGLLFAPVVFRRPLWLQAGWVYRPTCVVETGPLLDCLFVGPGYVSYYYGDCYRLVGGRWGFQPWILCGPRCYDPLFTYYRFHNRGNPRWEGTLRQAFLDRAAGRAPLPTRTLTPLARFNSPSIHLTSVTTAQRQAHLAAAQSLTGRVIARRQVETRTTTVARSSGASVQRSTTVTRKVESPAPRPVVTAPAHPALHPAPVIHTPTTPASGSRVISGKEVHTSKTSNAEGRSVTTRKTVVDRHIRSPAVHAPARETRTEVQQRQVRTITSPARSAATRTTTTHVVHQPSAPTRSAPPSHASAGSHPARDQHHR
jgi:hypothetical protein